MINKMVHKPEVVLTVTDPKVGLTGFLVIDDTSAGPGKGGMRMSADASLEETARLARTMTWKNGLFELPFGGAKSSIVWTGGDKKKKEALVRAFARQIKQYIPERYIAGPDINTGQEEMSWFADEVGQWNATTGKPRGYCVKDILGNECGLPHELGSTGYGVAIATILTADKLGMKPEKTSVGIHGFGNVGTFAALHLRQAGFIISLLADHSITIYRETGFTEKEIHSVMTHSKKLADLPGNRIPAEDFWSSKVDILIPASVTNVVNDTNRDRLLCRLIVEGANIPMTTETEEYLLKKGITIVPDFVANGGGIISSYAELRGLSPEEMMAIVKSKISSVIDAVMDESLKAKKNPRLIAERLASKNSSQG